MVKSKLDKFLGTMSEGEYHQVRIRINMAENLRSIEKTYKVKQTRMASKLGISPTMYRNWRNGAINFNLYMLAKIECVSTDLFAEQNDLIVITQDIKKK